MNSNEKIVKDVLSRASQRMTEAVEEIEEKATEELRKLYKGKRVKCECYDSFIDGDDYFFDTEILDIEVRHFYGGNIDDFYVVVTVMYKSMFAERDSDPKPHLFYLRKIERVYGEDEQ